MKKITFETVHSDTFISRLRFEFWFLLCLAFGAIPVAFTKGVDSNLIFDLFLAHRSTAMLLVSIFLPLGLTYLAGCFNGRGLLFPVIFCKASLFSYSALLIGSTVPNGGWLIACLLLIGDWLVLITYHQLWILCYMRHTKTNAAFYFIAFSVLFVIFLCEYFVFQPFAESLFINL